MPSRAHLVLFIMLRDSVPKLFFVSDTCSKEQTLYDVRHVPRHKKSVSCAYAILCNIFMSFKPE